MSGRLIIFVLAALAVVAPAAADPTRVEVREAEQRSITETIWFPAVTNAAVSATVVTEVPGVLTRIAQVGDVFETGETLGSLVDPARRIQLEEAERVARQQQAQLDLAVKQTARLEELVPSGAAAAVELDVARANLSFARTQLAVARSETAQVKSEMSRADIAAPFAGVVAARHGQLGERLAIGDPLVTLVAPGEVEINLIVPTRYAAILDIDEALRVRACEREVAAALTASVPQASGSDRSLLRLALSQQDRLLPGMAVQVEIPIKRLESAIVAPRDALVIRQEGAFVFRVDADRKAEKIPVDVLLGTGMNVAVKRRGEGPGLEAGDLLVVRGAETLQPDAELEPVPAAVRESAAGADAAFDELACR